MWELRWVLLALGIVLIAAVWIWSGRSTGDSGKSGKTARSQRRRVSREEAADSESGASAAAEGESSAAAAARDDADNDNDNDNDAKGAAGDNSTGPAHEQGAAEQPAAEQPAVEQPVPKQAAAEKASETIDKVITVRCQTKEGTMSVEQVILALRAAGLKHGRYDIFHRHAEGTEGEPLFSVANLTEPGSFDLTRASEATTAGITLFMVLPGNGDAVERFDTMTRTARELASELEAELYDESGSFWSIQRERYVRDEVILYGVKHEKR